MDANYGLSRSAPDDDIPLWTDYSQFSDPHGRQGENRGTAGSLYSIEDDATIASAEQYFEDDRRRLKPNTYLLDEEFPLQPVNNGERLDLFTYRAILSILIPVILIAYYTLTYVRWLRYPEESRLGWIRQGYLDTADAVNYSWFIIGTFALNLGTYALAGSVASMVMTKRWGPANARVLVSLAENTYSDPSSWLSRIVKIATTRSIVKGNNGILWNMLAVFSIIGFIAWPLTGLTMQTVDGYSIDLRSTSDAHVVVGRNISSFNARDQKNSLIRAFDLWRTGLTPQLPLIKQLFVTEDSPVAVNATGNDMPDAASTPIFLAPQAQGPIVGNVFGLAISYNCSIVTSMSNFTILSLRRETKDVDSSPPFYSVGNGTGTIFHNQLPKPAAYRELWNIKMAMELGVGIPLKNLTRVSGSSFDGYVPVPGQEEIPGLDDYVVLEIALWQNLTEEVVEGVVPEGFRYRHAETPIPELDDLYPGFGPAVGIRCLASSAIGFADVDGSRAIYRNFEPTVAEKRMFGYNGVRRFQNAIHSMIISQLDTTLSNSTTIPDFWGIYLYGSIQYYSWTSNLFKDAVGLVGSVIQAEDLRNSVLRAYQSYAVQLMYDGLPDEPARWHLTGIAVGTPAKMLVRGAVPPEVVFGLLSAWGLMIVILAAFYQFKRRWTGKLDAFSMFKFGVTRPEDVTPEQLAGRDGRKGLQSVPGTVGDTQASSSIGKIGLVRGPGTIAKRRKAYVK